VAAGEEFAAEVGVADEDFGREGLEIDGAFVVVELADEEVAIVEGGPTEEGIGLELHGALAFGDAAALVGGGGGRIGDKGGPGGGGFFLDLKEEGIVGAVAFEVDAEVAQADGAGADDFEGDVDGAVLIEEVAAIGLEVFAIEREGVEDGVALGAGDALEGGWGGVEDTCAVGVRAGGGFGVAGRGGFV